MVNLPLKITDIAKNSYNEIHGFHFAKREGKSLKYDVILDLEDDGSISEVILYNRLRNIKESIVEDIIEEGIDISNNFVILEKK